jgi:hypothetical protein
MNLEEMKSLCDAATPAPWGICAFRDRENYNPSGAILSVNGGDEASWPDMAFINAARTLLPKFIAFVDAWDLLENSAFLEKTSAYCKVIAARKALEAD